MKTLILGGARSGKSRYAEQLILGSNLQAIYIATATADDPEMAERIKKHQQQRGAQWQNIEEPIDIIKILRQTASNKNAVLVDCLTLWLSNLLLKNESEKEKSLTKVEQQSERMD